jgi:hypothetical protein
MGPFELGQSKEGYNLLIFVGLVMGILYMWVFQRPFWEASYILPLAVLATVLVFALFILIIHFLQES